MPILDQSDTVAAARYDDFVRSHPARTLTQDRLWAGVKQGWDCEAVYVERDGRIAAAMTVLVRSLPGGRSLLYAPRGPVVDWADRELVREVVAQAAPLARRRRAFALRMDPEVRFDPELDGWSRAQRWRTTNIGAGKDDIVQPRYNMIVRLTDEQGEPVDEEALLRKYQARTRTKIRAARRQGVQVAWGVGDDDLATFHRVYLEMAQRQQITARPLDYFQRMRAELGDRMRVYRAEHEGDVLAVAVVVDYYGKLYYLYAGTSDLKRSLAPSALLNHEIMLRGLSTGAVQYDLGGVFALDESDGLYRFKRTLCRADGVTEYLGQLDVVYHPALYLAFSRVLPKVQSARRALAARVARARSALAGRRAGRSAGTTGLVPVLVDRPSPAS